MITEIMEPEYALLAGALDHEVAELS
jgi:hypothetical protein